MTRLDETFLDRFHRLGAKNGEAFGPPPSRKLSLLIRPALVARPGKVLVWCDWSAIEARVLPWLAGSRSAEKVLDVFRTNDKDPSLPDIYKITAGELLKKDPREVTKDERQAYGKVPTLSLGFGGGIGALTAMATNYGVYLDTQTGEEVVAMWRDANPWARKFWGKHDRNESYGLWGAINSAISDPDTIYEAGRVAYVYDKSYLKGTVFCALPSGRLLTYPSIRWEEREVTDKRTKKTETKYQLTFRKGLSRSALWYGKLAENVTQAEAASVLRGTLRKLEYGLRPDLLEDQDSLQMGWAWEGLTEAPSLWMPTVMHTHDEAVTETDGDSADEAKSFLHDVFVEGFHWSAGLPLAAEASSNWYYTKAGD